MQKIWFTNTMEEYKKPEKHLKPRQHYIDRYDKRTIEKCRDIEKFHREVEIPKHQEKEFSEESKNSMKEMFSKLHNYFEAGERYKNKDRTIKEWMDKDQARDRLYENAKSPEDITCLQCGRLMFVSSKHLDYGWDDKEDRIMFFYDCPLKHIPRRAFYNDGEEYNTKPNLCPKCGSNLGHNSKRVDNKIITTEKCPNCEYITTDELDLTPEEKKEERFDPEYQKDKDRFCSDVEGAKYVGWKNNLDELSKIIEKDKEKEKNKNLYDKVANLKKLKIIELEKLIVPILEKADYVKLQFQTPQISKDVFVPFIVYDAKGERVEYDSIHNLKKLLKQGLENTNWRLMSEGISYRLGMLEGRLRAYEREDDLLKLVGGNKKRSKRMVTAICNFYP